MLTTMVNPFRCRVWDLHDRLDDSLTESSCKTEIASFASRGQLVPAIGRRILGDPDYEVEIICGARRLFIARHLSKALLVELRDMTDTEAIALMDIENRQRQDISPYERGLSYAHWLRASRFKSQDEIAQHLGISTSQVSRLLKLAQLPAIIVDAFPDARAICESWGCVLMDALQDPKRRKLIITKARSIRHSSQRLQSHEVYHQLSKLPSGYRARQSPRDRVINSQSGSPLFRIRQHRNSVAFLFPHCRVHEATLERIQQSIVSILQGDMR